MFEAPQWRHRQRHAGHSAYLASPGTSGIDEKVGLQRVPTLQRRAGDAAIRQRKADDAVGNVLNTERFCLSACPLQKTVWVAPSVARRPGRTVEVVHMH